MCGIFGILNNERISQDKIQESFEKGRGRGPESSHLSSVNIKAIFGFHRLAINGLNPESDQPIRIGDISLICNGEIYNYKELYALMGIEQPATDSDCEVIIHLYLKYGIEHTVQMLDGVFAFALLDGRIHLSESKLYLARDPYGVRPLYWIKDEFVPNTDTNTVAFASEVKSLIGLIPECMDSIETPKVEQFPPGHFCEFSLKFQVNSRWAVSTPKMYHTPGFSNTSWMLTHYKDVIFKIQEYFLAAVKKRCLVTERPVACLLSGGLDSSLVAAIVQHFKMENDLPPVETYSIGLADSEDLKYARIVAEYLGTKHTEVIITEEDFINAIPEVILAIESYDTTTVRASIGNYLLGKYIAQHSEAKVIFNGDGSDELAGGYLYMHACPDPIEFDKECRRLLRDIYQFDVLRSDKSISSHGLEPRTPFLDRSWVQFYLSIPAPMRYTISKHGLCEKELIRTAFYLDFWKETPRPLLPNNILWRKKEAFSDGVSNHGRSLYTILQEYTSTIITQYMVDSNPWQHNRPTTPEQYYYRSIFEKAYPHQGHLVPYFWMPKYVDAKDASARTLEIYGAYYKDIDTSKS